MKVWETWLPYTGAIMAIDPSGRGKDETAYAVVKMLNGFVFLLDAGGLQGGYTPEVMKALTDTAKAQKINKIVVESNFGDGMFVELLKPWLARADYRCSVEEVRHSTQKEKRICDTLEPVMAQHRLVVDKGVIRRDFDSVQNTYSPEVRHKYQLFYQMARISRDRGALSQDDRLDAVAMAVGECVAQMRLDVDSQVQERREELLLRELELWTEDDASMTTELSLARMRGAIADPALAETVWCGRRYDRWQAQAPLAKDLLGFGTGSGFLIAKHHQP
jgi:hypothetical protein